MPLFAYECSKCKQEYEAFDTNNKCPECGASGLKIISAPNFLIKGACSNPMNPPAPKKEEKKEEKRRRVFSDWFCPKCNHVVEDEFRYTDEEFLCSECNSTMEQLVGNLNFKLLFDPKKDMFDWQGNRSQYWSAVKAARRRGENVKGQHEKD